MYRVSMSENQDLASKGLGRRTRDPIGKIERHFEPAEGDPCEGKNHTACHGQHKYMRADRGDIHRCQMLTARDVALDGTRNQPCQNGLHDVDRPSVDTVDLGDDVHANTAKDVSQAKGGRPDRETDEVDQRHELERLLGCTQQIEQNRRCLEANV